MSSELVFLKWGGALITDKARPWTPRPDVIRRLAEELRRALTDRPQLRVLLGHGSGSFGHVVARRYGTRQGVSGAEGWRGFAETAAAAARLNRIVMDALLDAGVPAWSIQPSASARCRDGVLVDLAWETVARALDAGLVPVVYGDVALDDVRGGTIASTEEIFTFLAPRLAPDRIILASAVDGVYTSDPARDSAAERIPWLSPEQALTQIGDGAALGYDVTGGMATKVRSMAALVRQMPELRVHLISGLVSDRVYSALVGRAFAFGTTIGGAPVSE